MYDNRVFSFPSYHHHLFSAFPAKPKCSFSLACIYSAASPPARASHSCISHDLVVQSHEPGYLSAVSTTIWNGSHVFRVECYPTFSTINKCRGCFPSAGPCRSHSLLGSIEIG